MTKKNTTPQAGGPLSPDPGGALTRHFAATLAEVVRQSAGNGPINLRVRLEGVGEVEARIAVPAAPAPVESATLITPMDAAARVKKAKELLAAGAKYPKGCSGFVCDVLGIPWEAANELMGASPPSVGDNNNYTGLAPGDIAGWKTSAGSGHVTVYVGESGMKFIDVRTENEVPRKVGNGYGNGRPLNKSSRFSS